MSESAEPEHSESPSGEDAVDHDPTGLDLARRIAAAVGKGSTPRRPTGSTPKARRPVSGRSGDRDPKLLGPALDHLVSDRGWSTELNVHSLLGRWASLVGEVNAQHSTPESYADGVVVVRTDSTVWATSLRTIAPQLVARLNDELGQGTVTAIRVLGPAAPSWKHGRRSVRGRGPRDTYG